MQRRSVQVSAGEALRSRRAAAGWSQRDLAVRAGVSVRTIRDIERGRVARPHRTSLERLVAALPIRDAERAGLLAAFELADREPAARDPLDRAGGGNGPDGGDDLWIGVLGALSVRRGGAALEVGSAMPRALLGLLALRPGQPVSTGEIVDVLWEHNPPRTCGNLIQVYVGRLRSSLEPSRAAGEAARTILRTPDGYVLDVADGRLDLGRFDALRAEAERARTAGDRAGARELLAEALGCWRGPVLAGSPGALRDHPAAVAASRRRVEAALGYADAADGEADHRRVAASLWPLVNDEPLHEGLAARLMTALAGCGEQVAALRLFADIRARLAGELNVEPGTELRAAHLDILRRRQSAPLGVPAAPQAAPSSGAVAVPAQLPAAVPAFAGRVAPLRQLDRLLGRSEENPTIAVITGTAGVGKTALAVHWAHRVRHRFADGQLHVNLRGYAADGPLRPIDVLSRFLHSLGVPPDQVPSDQEEAAALYRTLLSGRRVLVLLDNAAGPDQVRPLLPGDTGSVAVITSRDALGGLVARDGAHRVVLDVLTARESHTLLNRLLGSARLRAEPSAALDLATLCGHLPLALRIAAANLLGSRHRTLAEYGRELREGNRLSALQVPGDPESAVRAAFQLSYAVLPVPARRLFRLLGLVTGPDATVPAMAALLDTTPAEAAGLVGVLTSAHLVDEPAPGRFAQHDLLRLCAAEYAESEETEDLRRAALTRLHRHYLATSDVAARLLYPQFMRLELPPAEVAPSPGGFDDHAAASAWLDGEVANLVAAVTFTAAHGPHELAWLIADTLRGYFFLRHSAVDWATVVEAGLAAAESAGNLRAQTMLRLSLAGLHGFQGRQRQALRYYTLALELARRSGWREGQIAVLGNLGATHADLGMLAQASDDLRLSLELNRELGLEGGQNVNLGNLGCVYLEMGRLREAADCLEASLAMSRRLGHRGSEANNLAALGEAKHALGRLDAAREDLVAALALHRQVGNRGNEADTMRNLAAVHRDAGRLAEALDLAGTALDASWQTGHRRLVADALNTLGTVHQHLGDLVAAGRHQEEALRTARAAGTRYPEMKALLGLAARSTSLGEHDAALRHADLALVIARGAGYRMHEGQALTARSRAHHGRHDTERAGRDAEQALAVHRETGHAPGEARALELLANIDASRRPRGADERP
ncbi:tetratricopeptide repeat protein [Streptosporangium sp. NBC_01495]|uniref:BTAD domain-containing putative transcriptional regulator n=1 Tax=Streptosporangium sp. NBC_01495 TaxID=2903899 RepID=UPI002E2F0929|nr:BTAD domain-containing putative transcriptional regulator [Streptosporangium sp. NBC_01495]